MFSETVYQIQEILTAHLEPLKVPLIGKAVTQMGKIGLISHKIGWVVPMLQEEEMPQAIIEHSVALQLAMV